METKIIKLHDNDTAKDYELLMVFDKDQEQYAALCDINDEESVIIMQLVAAGEEYIFETIEDENLAQELFVEFVSQWETLGDDE